MRHKVCSLSVQPNTALPPWGAAVVYEWNETMHTQMAVTCEL